MAGNRRRRSVCLWDCSGKGPVGDRKPRQYDAHPSKLTQLAFQPDGDLLASADAEAFLFLWDPIKHKKIIGGVSLSSSASCLRWCKGGKLAVGQQDGKVVIFEVQSETSDESRSVLSKLNPFA